MVEEVMGAEAAAVAFVEAVEEAVEAVVVDWNNLANK